MKKYSVFLVALIASTAFTNNAYSYICQYNVDYGTSVSPTGQTGGRQVSNGFYHYTRLWCYSGSYWAQKYLRDYSFRPKYSWLTEGVVNWVGTGYNSVSVNCSESYYPFHRIMSAYRFIDYAGLYTRFSSSKTWDEMARDNIDETRIACSSSSLTDGDNSSNASTDAFSNVTIYYRGIYSSLVGTPTNPITRGNTLGELASTIIHESRHAWYRHNGESCVGSTVSCDESWSNSPVNKDQIKFLWDVYKFFPARRNQNLTPPNAPINRSNNQEYLLSEPQLDLMRDKGNYRLRTMFDTRPNFIIGASRAWVL